jgi:hypothetical protein
MAAITMLVDDAASPCSESRAVLASKAEMKRELLLLTDYKGEYWVRHKHTRTGTDCNRLADHLRERGYDLVVKRFTDVDFRAERYAGRLVLYQSAQDPGLLYRSYIEDIVLGLELAGAKLIPPFHLLRAHHNKVFMEILRDQSPIEEIKNLRARSFGTYEDLQRAPEALRLPAVLKLAASDTGQGVALLEDPRRAHRQIRRMSRSLDLTDLWNNLRRRAMRAGIAPNSLHRRKFIVQDFVPGLDHDYKSVVLGRKYFVTVRPTRPGDFRASGSKGARGYPTELPAGLLELLERVATGFRAPFASIDVMHDGRTFYLGEFQFVRFGTNPVIKHSHYWTRAGEAGFARIEGSFEWERELATAIADHVETHGL